MKKPRPESPPMVVYRFAYAPYLPATWAYSDESDALPGAQVWKDERDVAFAAVGGDVDGRYDDQPLVLVLDVDGCSGDTGGCDWAVVLPGDLRSARSVPTAALVAWVREQTAADLDDEPEGVSRREVATWAEDHREEVAAWLLATSAPVELSWQETLG